MSELQQTMLCHTDFHGRYPANHPQPHHGLPCRNRISTAKNRQSIHESSSETRSRPDRSIDHSPVAGLIGGQHHCHLAGRGRNALGRIDVIRVISTNRLLKDWILMNPPPTNTFPDSTQARSLGPVIVRGRRIQPEAQGSCSIYRRNSFSVMPILMSCSHRTRSDDTEGRGSASTAVDFAKLLTSRLEVHALRKAAIPRIAISFVMA